MPAAATSSTSTHHHLTKKPLTAMRPLVMAGMSEPSSANVFVKAGTAFTITMMTTIIAVTMTIAG